MAVAKRRSLKTRTARAGKVPEPKATTFRLDPVLKQGLEVLGKALEKPINRLVNEAVRGFIERRGADVQAEMQRSIDRLQACREQDPDFELAIARLVEGEATLGQDDPFEGALKPAAGSAQAMVRDLLRG